jgi:hypothetical protein
MKSDKVEEKQTGRRDFLKLSATGGSGRWYDACWQDSLGNTSGGAKGRRLPSN